MNTKPLLFAAMAFFAAASAMAQDVTPDNTAPFMSTLTRAEVRQAAIEARAAGLISHGDRSFVAEPTGMAKTRAQVVAETLEAIRLGAIDRRELSSSPTPAQLESIRMAGLKALPMIAATI